MGQLAGLGPSLGRWGQRLAIGLLKVQFTVSATDRSVRGTIGGSIWVVRT